MKKTISILLTTIVVCSLWSIVYSLAFAQENEEKVVELGQIFITPYRIEEYSQATAASTNIISSEELETKDTYLIKDGLRDIQGVDVVQAGNLGGPTSVFIRGAERRHTQVLIDGIRVSDVISPDGSFDLSHITADNIDRIEIVRGAQSALYGSDAIGGVINTITRKGVGKPGASVSFEGGSFYTYREKFDLQGQYDMLHFSLGLSRLDSRGYSRAKEKDNNKEKDGYENSSLSARVDADVMDNLTIGAIARLFKTKYEYDDSGGPGADDPNLKGKDYFTFLDSYIQHRLFDILSNKVSFAFTSTKRRDRDENDSSNAFDYMRAWYQGRTYTLDWQSNLDIIEKDTVLFGITHQNEKGQSYYNHVLWGTSDFPKRTNRTTGYYIENRFTPVEQIALTQGFRIEDHQRFGTHNTYKLDGAYTLPTDTKIFGSYATGFKAPTLYQNYLPTTTFSFWGLSFITSGNPELRPEKSKSYDIGIEQVLFNKKLKFGGTYFHNLFKDLIVFTTTQTAPTVFLSTYSNTQKAVSKGFELYASCNMLEKLTLSANYTRTRTRDKSTAQHLLRRPTNKFNVNIDFRPVDKLDLNFDINYVGSRYDNTFTANPYVTKLKPYTKVDFAFYYDPIANLRLFGRVENLFNEKYEEIWGYQTPKFSAYGGVKLSY